jgi:predicted transcriptional regulator
MYPVDLKGFLVVARGLLAEEWLIIALSSFEAKQLLRCDTGEYSNNYLTISDFSRLVLNLKPTFFDTRAWNLSDSALDSHKNLN